MVVQSNGAANGGLFVREPDTPAASDDVGAVLVGLEPDRTDAMGGELFVTVLGVAGDTDRADHLALRVADLQAAALGKNLVV